MGVFDIFSGGESLDEKAKRTRLADAKRYALVKKKKKAAKKLKQKEEKRKKEQLDFAKKASQEYEEKLGRGSGGNAGEESQGPPTLSRGYGGVQNTQTQTSQQSNNHEQAIPGFNKLRRF